MKRPGMEKVFITGANGYIGSHITEKFLEENIPLVCMVRKNSDVSSLPVSSIDIRYGDVIDEASIVEASRGCSTVIHNAARSSDWGSYHSFYNINVEGTLNVLRACVRNGITRVIMTGAVSSYGEENSHVVKSESHPFNSHYRYFMDSVFPNANNHYRDTKAIATRDALLFAEKHGLDLTVIEPVWVYGEREFNTGFYEYMKGVKDGMFIAPGTRKNKFHVVYVKDLARAYHLAYIRNPEGVNRIIIGNSTTEYMHRIFSLFIHEAGLKKPILAPKWLLYPIGFAMELAYSLTGAKTPPLLSRSRVNMFYDNIEYSTRKAKEFLGFENEFTLEQGIGRTVSWYREHQLI